MAQFPCGGVSAPCSRRVAADLDLPHVVQLPLFQEVVDVQPTTIFGPLFATASTGHLLDQFPADQSFSVGQMQLYAICSS